MRIGLFFQHLRYALAVLVAGNIISTLITANFAGDGSGWWPVYFVLVCTVSITYSISFSVIAAWRKYTVFPSAYVHMALALVSILILVLYYTSNIDWRAINAGAKLTMVELALSSDYTIYVVHIMAFLFAVVLGFVSKSREAS